MSAIILVDVKMADKEVYHLYLENGKYSMTGYAESVSEAFDQIIEKAELLSMTPDTRMVIQYFEDDTIIRRSIHALHSVYSTKEVIL